MAGERVLHQFSLTFIGTGIIIMFDILTSPVNLLVVFHNFYTVT